MKSPRIPQFHLKNTSSFWQSNMTIKKNHIQQYMIYQDWEFPVVVQLVTGVWSACLAINNFPPLLTMNILWTDIHDKSISNVQIYMHKCTSVCINHIHIITTTIYHHLSPSTPSWWPTLNCSKTCPRRALSPGLVTPPWRMVGWMVGSWVDHDHAGGITMVFHNGVI